MKANQRDNNEMNEDKRPKTRKVDNKKEHEEDDKNTRRRTRTHKEEDKRIRETSSRIIEVRRNRGIDATGGNIDGGGRGFSGV